MGNGTVSDFHHCTVCEYFVADDDIMNSYLLFVGLFSNIVLSGVVLWEYSDLFILQDNVAAIITRGGVIYFINSFPKYIRDVACQKLQ